MKEASESPFGINNRVTGLMEFMRRESVIHHVPQFSQVRIQDNFNPAVLGPALLRVIAGDRTVFTSADCQ